MEVTEFEKKVGIKFKNKELLKQAFIHRSYINENRNLKLPHNERLEFLGDAVLELVVTDFLFHTYLNEDEGVLTAYRAALVNAVTLSAVATELGMNDFLLLSKGESKDNGRARQFILADTFEAVVGALYEDQGYDSAKNFLAKNIFPLIESIIEKGEVVDAKSRFQEIAQEKASLTPQYKTIREVGPDHDKRFTVGVFLGDVSISEGEGKSKQEAEQDAAKKALLSSGWTEGK